ncbi:MAG: HDOD domain-containing protein [Campylobacterota bacterium]|nr:HDOD domain-containing protein [Campylobacterota bacterium]
MITKQDIELYIDKIPATPKVLKDSLNLLNQGELTKSAAVAQEDLALNAYLKNLVNKPVYGLKNSVKNTPQIFTILGIPATQQVLYNYMINLLSPDEWLFFKLNASQFNNLQAELSINWHKILTYLHIKDKDIESSIALLPASIIIAEAIFNKHIEDVNLIRTNNNIDLNSMLKRLSGVDLFDLSKQISTRWDISPIVGQIIKSASGIEPSQDREVNTLAKWMHLLLFYTLSRETFVNAGLNDFIDFKIDYVLDIYDQFAIVMEIS